MPDRWPILLTDEDAARDAPGALATPDPGLF